MNKLVFYETWQLKGMSSLSLLIKEGVYVLLISGYAYSCLKARHGCGEKKSMFGTGNPSIILEYY